jgi:hypothetical protein
MHELFDFLRWALSDFWRFVGLILLIVACGSIIPSYRSVRKVLGTADIKTTEVAK